MSLGLYIHIPFCLQQCPYCDFTTLKDEPSLHQSYVDRLLKEIKIKSNIVERKSVSTIYFGGGTPSLLSNSQIMSIISCFSECGFEFEDDIEISLEINPGTIDQEKIDLYLESGINRFSIGVQTFDDKLLKTIGRKHDSKESFDSLSLLKKNDLNYSFDLLFSLPGQSYEILKRDLELIKNYEPPHISSYYLTIPQRHRLNHNRPSEDLDLKMFDLVENSLAEMGYEQYEISNYSKPSFHSRHNLNAWKNHEYLGIGISAHSHLKINSKNIRFWNPNTVAAWEKELNDFNDFESQNDRYVDLLSEYDIFNDIVHTSLRLNTGLNLKEIVAPTDYNFSHFQEELFNLSKQNYLSVKEDSFVLTKKGRRTLNFVLEKLFITSN